MEVDRDPQVPEARGSAQNADDSAHRYRVPDPKRMTNLSSESQVCRKSGEECWKDKITQGRES